MVDAHTTLHYRMVGWVGDKPEQLEPHLFADADFAGCLDSQRSTTGLHLAIRGPATCFPIDGATKQRTCVSHSTPEAEIVAADFALRTAGLPALQLWDTLFERPVSLVFHEDNQAMIRVCQTGRNPTMRHIGRTHRTSVAWMHEVFAAPNIKSSTKPPTGNALTSIPRDFMNPTNWHLYTSDAADDLLCVDLGCCRLIKKKKKRKHT